MLTLPGPPAAQGKAQEHVYLGQAYAEEGTLANALAQYERALEIEPAHEIALEDMGTVYARRGDMRQAVATWERLLHHYPDSVRVRHYLAELSFQATDYALPHVRSLEERAGTDSEAHREVGKFF